MDAEDSTAAVSSPSLRRTGSRLHKSEAWRLKNRQAQKKFRQRKKVRRIPDAALSGAVGCPQRTHCILGRPRKAPKHLENMLSGASPHQMDLRHPSPERIDSAACAVDSQQYHIICYLLRKQDADYA